MGEDVKAYGRRRARRYTTETISVQGAADLLGVSPATIRRMIKAKKLRTVQAIPVLRIELAYLRRRCGLGEGEK